jgi:cytochrome c-type biogenesis protein CcmH
MMLAFVLLTGALTAGAAVLLLRPLLKRRADAQPVDGLTAGVVLFLLFAAGGGLYAAFSQFSWSEPPVVADTPAAKAAKLARELASDANRLEGWLELGDLYFDLQQFPLAYRAFQRADRLANGSNVAAISGAAETLLAQDFENIRGPAGRMFERVLEMEPRNAKALLYSALAAMARGENASARDRFNRMLALNPREDIRLIIEKQLQALDAAEAQGGAQPAADAAGAQVRVLVTVAPSLRYQLTGQSALFVAARDPNQPGPPFAAKRLPLEFPVEVTLTAADAMLPGRHIAAGQTLDVVARISLSGQPQSVSGDPFGQVSYHVGKDKQLNIVIDRLAP